MDRTGTRGGVAAEGRRARRADGAGLSGKQRLHLAALLIALAALPLQAQSGIDFDPATTRAEFEKLSRLVAQGIYATPVEPAHSRSLMGFDFGIAVTAVPVDTDAPYWRHAVPDDFSVGGHVGLPRLVASKGLGFGTVSASYSRVQDTDIEVWGAALDVPVIDGGLLEPTLALRGSWADLRGAGDLDLTTWGLEAFVSKAFGPVTPYGAAGLARSDAEGRIAPGVVFTDEATTMRCTLGVKLSLFFPKIVVEATQGEERSYAAKISFGL